VIAPRWPLAILLDLAEQRESAAAVALADALGEEGACRLERDGAAEALRAHLVLVQEAARRGPGCAAGLLAAQALHLARLRAAGDRLAGRLGRREAALAAAAAEVGRRLDERAAARAAVGALEETRETWRATRRRARERAEEDERSDEISARWRGESSPSPRCTRP
jgi:hypothetical protein